MTGGLVPNHVELRTTDMARARAFCQKFYYEPLRIDPVGDPGRFDFRADLVELGPITVGEVGYGTDIRVAIGSLETAYHVLVPLTGELRSRHRGAEVLADPTRAAVFRPTGDIELDWPGNCRLLSVKVERGALERELDAALDQRVVSPLPLGASFDLVDGPGRTWVALVLALSVEHPYGEEPAGLQGPFRPRTVKRALDVMHAEPWRPLTTTELAAASGVGVRVLQDAFRQHVGMSPMTYLRRLRLDGVHAELTRCDPGSDSVSEVAYRWGFTHLGRFAGAYRARFGVPPSATLRDHS
jgi:AraC-like DNA-binding protein